MEYDLEDLLLLMGRNQRIRADLRNKLRRGGKNVLGHLLRALKSNRNSMVRRNAALILGEIGNRVAVDALIKALEDRVVSVSSNAAIALGMIGDRRAVRPLISRLVSSSWQVRLNAAISLGWLADRKASGYLMALLRDQHAYVRRGAAFALGQIGNPALRESLLKLLTDPKGSSYEAALVLASMGDLSGYLYLDFPVPALAEIPLPQKSSKKAVEALKLGNLFYVSSMFPSATAEYRRALAADEKNSTAVYGAVLNNLGNTFRALGQPDHAIVFYLLGLRLKPQDRRLLENLKKAETLSDIQELVLERVRKWMDAQKRLAPPPDFLCYYKSVCAGLGTDAAARFLPHYLAGWKAFHAMEAYRGESPAPLEMAPAPEFLMDHVPVCRSIFVNEPPFRPFYHLILKISDGLLAPKDADTGEETLSLFHEAFLCGYVSGLLQKIWYLSHLRFSLN